MFCLQRGPGDLEVWLREQMAALLTPIRAEMSSVFCHNSHVTGGGGTVVIRDLQIKKLRLRDAETS